MNSRTRSSPSATIFSGLSAAANSAGVALFTPASVACAESATATRSVYGLIELSSVVGAGLSFLKRRKASSTSAGDHGFGLPDLPDFFFGTGGVLRAMEPV